MRRTVGLTVWFTAAVLIVVAATSPVAAASPARVCPAAGPGCPFTSIQAAINASGGGTISIARGTYRENLKIAPSAASRLTLSGEGGPGAVILDGGQRDSVVTVTPGHTLTLIGLTLTHGNVLGVGGGLANIGGTVSVINSRIVDNTARGDFTQNQGIGGGVFSIDAIPPATASGGGNLTLISTLVSGNRASTGGGVSSISFTAGTHATLVNTTVERNTATTGGAGGVQNCGTLTMTSSPIRNNTAPQGGGLTNCGLQENGLTGTARLTSSPVTGNKATGPAQFPGGPPPGHGGGISNGGSLTLIASPVTGNSAVGPGGGIFNAPPGTVTRIPNTPVTGNSGNPPANAQCFGTPC